MHEKRASPPRQDLAIVYPRSRLVGLEISHINATDGAGPPSRAEQKSHPIHIKLSFLKFLSIKIFSPWAIFSCLLVVV